MMTIVDRMIDELHTMIFKNPYRRIKPTWDRYLIPEGNLTDLFVFLREDYERGV